MILVAAWHGLRSSEVTGFTRDAVRDGHLTIQRVKGGKITVQRLVRDEDPLLDERSALIDFVQKAPPDRPVFNIGRRQFWNLVRNYAKAAGIPEQKANPRALQYSVTVQNLAPSDMDEARAAVTAAQAEVKAAKAKLKEAETELKEAGRRQSLSGKPAWMQVAGNFLLDNNPLAANLEILTYLDKMKVQRRDQKLWVTLTNKPSIKNDLSDLRKLLGIQRLPFGRELQSPFQ